MVTKPSFSPSQLVSVKIVSGWPGLPMTKPDVARLAVADDAVRGDLHVVDGVVELAIDAAHAPRPLVVDHRLEAEDQLVLVHRIHVRVDFAAQVADRAVALRVVDRADLRAEDRPLAGRAVVVERLEAEELVEGALVEEAAGLLDVDDVGDRQEVAAGVAEQLAATVALHVPGEAEARRDHVVHLDVAVAVGVLVVERFARARRRSAPGSSVIDQLSSR